MESTTFSNFKSFPTQNTFIQKSNANNTISNNSSINTAEKQDIADLSTKKSAPLENNNNKSNIRKIIAGLGIITAAVGIAIYLFKNRKMPNTTPALNMQGGQRAGHTAQSIAEHIDFKKAKTIDEAKQYGIENLGIKEYIGFSNKKQDLDVINWINEGITNVSNHAKGKTNIPKCIYFGNDMPEAAFASGCGSTTTVDGHIVDSMLGINKRQVNNLGNFLVDLKNNIENFGIAEKGQDGKYAIASCFADTKESQKFLEYMEMVDKGQIKTFGQKIKARSYMIEYQEVLERAVRAPYITIKNAPELKNNATVQSGIENLKNSTLRAQADYLDDIIYNPNSGFKLKSKSISPFKSIYHEMGHINDKILQQRPGKTLDFNNDYSNYPKALKDWVDNTENMQIANYVSLFSADGPEEFIAEVFAKTLAGAKFPKSVIDLYNRLNGPKLL